MDGFHEAWLHKEHIVCGRKLQPYSASHVLALSAVQSPFAVGGGGKTEGVTPRTLILACKIAASRDPLNARLNVTVWDKLWYLRLRFSPRLFLEQVEAFNAYIVDYFTLPETWKPAEDEDEIFEQAQHVRGPWLLTRVASIISQTSISLKEAMSMPLGQIFWLDAALAELKGGDVFAEDEEALEGLDAPVSDDVIRKLEKKRNERIRKARRKQDGR
jgi:hypothetical protein